VLALVERCPRGRRPAPQIALAAAAAHLEASLPHVADHYAGSHWLATFALLALDP
jgi:hypothetical protein